ncbi:MAG: gamma-glutamylcyclotransferase [Cytophagales bacterium]|nr:MAG: gamma-glutamylcyclotransferase [Cytophagales bacterium]
MPAAHQPAITDLLFVYGTLMQGFDNPYARTLNEQSHFVGAGSLPGSLYRVDWYPGAVPDASASTRIYGEVYQLYNSAEILRFLDDYEEVRPDGTGLYVRKALPVQVGPNQLICWTYVYNQSVANLVMIEGGRWSKE